MPDSPQPIKIDRVYLLAGNQSIKTQIAECTKAIEDLSRKREQLFGALSYNEALIATQPEQ